MRANQQVLPSHRRWNVIVKAMSTRADSGCWWTSTWWVESTKQLHPAACLDPHISRLRRSMNWVVARSTFERVT